MASQAESTIVDIPPTVAASTNSVATKKSSATSGKSIGSNGSRGSKNSKKSSTSTSSSSISSSSKRKEKKGKKKKSKPQQQQQQQHHDEGLLRDVLGELDRERSTRAELEAKVRVLEQDLHAASVQRTSSNQTTLSSRDFIALQAERDGYLQILDALLQDRPAFGGGRNASNAVTTTITSKNSAANNNNTNQQPTLPLHVLRMLEIIPWDPRARPHLFAQEQVLEWQMYSADKTWQKELRYFPSKPFKSLPCIVPQPGQTVGEAPTSSSPPKQCVLTNMPITRLLNIDKGYPLPKDGGSGVWKWVGGWRIEKNQNTDESGWSYSNSIDLHDDQSYYGELRMPEKGVPNLVKRRRKWTRLRVLIDYPHASPMTKEYLKLVAEKAELDVTVEKLSAQLVETKMNLTTLEADHMAYKEKMTRRVAALEQDLAEKNRLAQLIDDVNPSTKESVKELKSAVTQWVTNTVSKRNSSTSTMGNSSDGNTVASEDDEELAAAAIAIAAVANNNNPTTKQLVFESLKEKGGGFLDKIKRKGGEDLLEKLKQNGSNLITLTTKNKSSSSSANTSNDAATATTVTDEEATKTTTSN